MGPRSTGKLGSGHTSEGVHRFDDLAVSDIDSDVSFVPNSKTGHFGDRIDHSFNSCRFEHTVCRHVFHAVRAYYNITAGGIIPTVSFNQSHAIGGAFSHPIGADKVHIACNLTAEH